MEAEEDKTLTHRMWHQELENILIEGGLRGYRDDKIWKYFEDRVEKEEINDYLELLLKEDKVQKFKYNRHCWWRATVNIKKVQ